MKTATAKTEYEIQDWLYWFTRHSSHESQVPNIYLYAWESDFISVTRAGLVHEFEIKISRADFKNDFKKDDKHLSLHSGCCPLSWHEYPPALRNTALCEPDKLERKETKPTKRPNYFWYVCPPGIIPLDDVPKYAGLIYTDAYYQVEPLRAAPRLHKEHITEGQRERINRSFGFKYWALRNNARAVAEAKDIAQNSLQQTLYAIKTAHS